LDYLVYEDNPWPYMWVLTWNLGWERYKKVWLRNFAWRWQAFFITIVIFIAGMSLAATLDFTQDFSEARFFSILGVTLFLMLLISFAVMPTKYQIFNDRIRIMLGWILHFDIPFNNVENITSATFQDLWGLNLNFINSYSSDDILRITRKHGAKIHITPWDRTQFLENLNKTLADWRRSNPGT
jgi:hypothetical protein